MSEPVATERIAIVGPSWVGDMVMAQSLFISLKQKNPECVIDVIAPSWSVPILARMPEVRQGIPLAIGHGDVNLKARFQLGKSLRHQYQRAIVLPRSLKAALVPFFAKIPVRTGFLGEMRYGLLNDIRPFDRSHLNQTVKRFVALGLTAAEAQTQFPIPYPALSMDVDGQQRVLTRLGLNSTQPAIALFPGAEYGPAKQWPLEYFAELAGLLSRRDYQVWVMGSEKDKAAAEVIVSQSSQDNPGGVMNLCGQTSLSEAIDLIAGCHGAVSNDSGLMHVAAAANCPVLGIYGSSSPGFTPPLTKRSKILHLNLDCSPCFERTCPLKTLDCLKHITPQAVFDELGLLLGN